MNNLIPITKIYDIYPKYTFSKDVMRFMDDIVDIPRTEVFSKDEVIAMLTEIKDEISSNYLIDGDTGEIISGRLPRFKAQKLLDRINNEINKLREGEL